MRRCWLLRPSASALGWVKGARSSLVRNDSHDVKNEKTELDSKQPLHRGRGDAEARGEESRGEQYTREDTSQQGRASRGMVGANRKRKRPFDRVPIAFVACA